MYGYFPKSDSCCAGKKGIFGCLGCSRAILCRRPTLERQAFSARASRWRAVRVPPFAGAAAAWLADAGRSVTMCWSVGYWLRTTKMKNIAATQNQRPQTSRHVSFWGQEAQNDVIPWMIRMPMLKCLKPLPANDRIMLNCCSRLCADKRMKEGGRD